MEAGLDRMKSARGLPQFSIERIEGRTALSYGNDMTLE